MGGCSGGLREICILRCEPFAIWKGLILAWDKGFRQVICETDSLDAFNLVHCELSYVMEHRDLVSKIKDVELLPWSMRITLIQRSANNAADYLAKQAASSQLPYREWSDPSYDINLVIQQDCIL
ncbi:hypothetical protein PIB30_096649 [Stylosanthes scabra]|uniref:RNase H type-1 domain-containing protein n=1 Tax=Stylosanthes scabra TaxID=79078 RepID=A0ABU6YXF9_9FABA|nr:hypothetical protein [Stylosanthes scabra]